MKKLLIILMLTPLLSYAQQEPGEGNNGLLQSISLNCDGLGIPQDQDYNVTINNLLHTDGLSFVPVNGADISQEENGLSHIILQQVREGVPVEHAFIRLHYNSDGLYYINGAYANLNFSDEPPSLPQEAAFQQARAYIGAGQYIWDNQEELQLLAGLTGVEQVYPVPVGVLVYYGAQEGQGGPAGFRKAYRFDMMALQPYSRYHIYIDAVNGFELGRTPVLWESNADTRYSGSRNICTSPGGAGHILREGSYACTLGPGGVETYNMQGGGSFGGAIDYTDADDNWTAGEFHNAAKDDAGLEAHWAAEKSMAYFNFIMGRNSYDNAGGIVKGYVNTNLTAMFGPTYSNDNAFWDGSRMIFGKGNTNPVVALDIVGHELGHALCQYTAGWMLMEGEPGAIAEGLSDIWGSLIERTYAPTKSKWLIGEDVFSGGLRNMQNPLAKNDPKFYGGTNWVNTSGCTPSASNDYCGIHTNCTVLDYWFYLMAESPFPGIGAVGDVKARDIIYRTETMYLTPTDGYWTLRSHTIQAARDLYGDCSDEVKRTINAWADVGLGSGAPSVPSSLYLTSPISSSGSYLATQIFASNQIVPPASVIYQAMDRVELQPGFNAGNTFFMAQIVTCRDVFQKGEGPSANGEDMTQGNGSLASGVSRMDKLVPNPATSQVTLYSGMDLSNAIISVSDVSGKACKVRVQKPDRYEATISWDQLPAGIYLLKVVSGEQNKAFKLVVSGQ